MLARAHTFTIEGLRTRAVGVEVDIRLGLPAFTVVGLADVAVREARERVHAAILNCDFEFPARRITANLAPADVPKAGPGLDLALACAILAASGQIPAEPLESHALFGELSLDGRLRGCDGTLAVAQATRRAGLRTLILAPERAREAGLVEGLGVAVAGTLGAAVRVLRGGPGDQMPPLAPGAGARDERGGLDLEDVQGQPEAIEAIVLAAAGGHNLLLSGPPGTGKTMLAQRLPSIMPPLSRAEALEVTRIASIAGRLHSAELVRERPFRAPHHSTTSAGLVGSARRGSLGEVVLAHNGVLFLDELSEFARPALNALRQPLEEGRVAIVRAGRSAVHPARFMLLAATNPCACGYVGEVERCRCTDADLARHRRRFNGPLIDRIDLLAHMPRPDAHELRHAPRISSAEARGQVLLARERQAARLRADGILVNAHMDARTLRRRLAADEDAESVIFQAQERGLLSARAIHRVLRVARTVADLEGSSRTTGEHVRRALCHRPEDALAGEGRP